MLPGGNLVAAIMDRSLMRLSDRGGASGLIGDRWAALCAETLSGWVGDPSAQPGQNGTTIWVDRVIRLDDLPHIACMASRQKLQSPDFLVLGRVHGQPAIQAADAKFSVETARSRQVSTHVLAELLTHLPEIRAMLGDEWAGAELVPGMFLCPDYPLTGYMLRGQRGLRRVTVRPHEVTLLPVEAHAFLAALPAAELVPAMFAADRLAIDPDESVLAALYYYRLVRACITCWVDETRPLLGHPERQMPELDVIRDGIARHRAASTSAYGVLMAWQRDAARVQADREQVERAAALPIAARDLRALISTRCGDDDAPSMNQVRRRLASWYNAQLLAAIGPIHPPVADLEPVLRAIRAVAGSLRQATQAEAVHIVTSLREERRLDGALEATIAT